MHSEVAGFAKVASEYERGRPEYPEEAVGWIAEQTGLGPGTVVVDLAAGTGKLTRQLVRTGATVVAVEPLPEMLSALISVLPQVQIVVGTAESTGLPSDSATAVTVGEAFHWFSTPEALGEIHRILEPGGHLALAWNRRDPTQELQTALTRVMARYRHKSPPYRNRAWVQVMDGSPLFEPVDECRFGFTHLLDADGLTARVASTSYIANLPPSEHAEVLEGVRELVPGDIAELAYDCTVHLFRAV